MVRHHAVWLPLCQAHAQPRAPEQRQPRVKVQHLLKPWVVEHIGWPIHVHQRLLQSARKAVWQQLEENRGLRHARRRMLLFD
jgi:hypothetical protein